MAPRRQNLVLQSASTSLEVSSKLRRSLCSRPGRARPRQPRLTALMVMHWFTGEVVEVSGLSW